MSGNVEVRSEQNNVMLTKSPESITARLASSADARRIEIINEISSLNTERRETKIKSPDEGDIAKNNEGLDRRNQRQISLMKEISEIGDFLQRVQDDPDSILLCDECGEEIGIRRLEARPTTLCVSCKQIQEREEEAKNGGRRVRT